MSWLITRKCGPYYPVSLHCVNRCIALFWMLRKNGRPWSANAPTSLASFRYLVCFSLLLHLIWRLAFRMTTRGGTPQIHHVSFGQADMTLNFKKEIFS